MPICNLGQWEKIMEILKIMVYILLHFKYPKIDTTA